MAKDLAIFGMASTYAEELVQSALRLGLDFDIVDNLKLSEKRIPGVITELGIDTPEVIVAPGSSSERALAVANALALGAKGFVNLIDPTSVLATTVTLGCGNYINSLVSIASGTQIHCHTNLNRSSSIGHHCVIESFVSTGPGVVISGSVSVGMGSFIGAGSTVLPKVRIGRNVVIGAGSVVTKDIEDGVVAYGNPARVHKSIETWIYLDKCPYQATHRFQSS